MHIDLATFVTIARTAGATLEIAERSGFMPTIYRRAPFHPEILYANLAKMDTTPEEWLRGDTILAVRDGEIIGGWTTRAWTIGSGRFRSVAALHEAIW